MTNFHAADASEIVAAPVSRSSDSESVRVRQLALVECFRDEAAQMGIGLEGDEKLFPPADVLRKIDMIWTDKRQDPEQRGGDKISLRDVTKRAIFSRTRVSGSKNDGYLLGYDPAVMPLVKGMIDEYVLCEHWDQMGAAILTEGVRAQVGDHYSRLLMERGYGPEQALKVIGNGIKAYMTIATRMRWYETSAIKPLKTGEAPDVMIHAIQAHGRAEAEKQGCRDVY